MKSASSQVQTPSKGTPSKPEGPRALNRSGYIDSDDLAYFFSKQTPTSQGTGTNTSESEVSPFGLPRPRTLHRRAAYNGSSLQEWDGNGTETEIDIEKPEDGREKPSLGKRRRGDISDWNEKVHNESSDTIRKPCGPSPSLSNFTDPPRPAKEGMEWVWFPEGYWAERERRELFSTSEKQTSFQKWFNRKDDQSEEISPTLIPQIKIGSVTANSRRESTMSRKSLTATIAKSGKKSRLSSADKEGIYDKTKRTIESKILRRKQTPSGSAESEKISPRHPKSRTTMLLEGTSTQLEKVRKELLELQQIHTQPRRTFTSRTPASPETRRRRGRAPWHRRQSNESMWSVSSSVHKILMGKSPAASPASASDRSTTKSLLNDQGKHVGPKLLTGFLVDPLNPKKDTFLPSEATRIKTPPMTPGTPPTIPPPRGFFYDNNTLSPNFSPRLSPSIDGPEQQVTTNTSGSPISTPGSRLPFTGIKRSNGLRHKRKVEGPGYGEFATGKFEIEIPEHLPNSPLCPKNPRHKSGGTGICVYHGRAIREVRSEM
ncbi:hypothetical protein HYFRA_00010419 [Hymenoscyphus fraxineus]|uniref:Uncharacterized protein n=1 Tax=Hymenoscyphus fraxineus TaxID=746836 RepID=A0A9N9L3M6_9HELO|nr:hypothetical protein HYFRA_00010419 [Hymenoscyphus fraxineus]